MEKSKTVALVAHDNRKLDLTEWAKHNAHALKTHILYSAGTTGRLVEGTLKEMLHAEEFESLSITKLKSSPLGEEQQLGACILAGGIGV